MSGRIKLGLLGAPAACAAQMGLRGGIAAKI
jgi:hypothetical protein